MHFFIPSYSPYFIVRPTLPGFAHHRGPAGVTALAATASMDVRGRGVTVLRCDQDGLAIVRRVVRVVEPLALTSTRAKKNTTF